LRKRVTATLVCIGLVLLIILSACAQQGGNTTTSTSKPGATTGSTGGAKVEPTYKVLNPTGLYIPVDCKANAPRLDSLTGKKILYYESEATNILMPTLLEKLKKDYPTSTFDVIYTATFGEITPTADQLTHNAVIRGVGW